MKIIVHLAVFAFLLAGCATVNFVEKNKIETARRFYIQGLLYEADGDMENALAQYKKSFEIDSENSFVAGKIAKVLLKERKYQQAEKFFKRAISLNEQDPENFLNLGLVYFYLKSYDKAIFYIEKGLKIKEFPSYRMVLCDLYVATNQYDKALGCYKILIESFPSNFLLHYNYGLLLEKLNKKNEAEESFLTAIKFQPVFYKSYLELGSIYDEQNNTDSAIKYYTKAMEIAPADPSAYEKLASLYIRQENPQKLEEILVKAIKLNIQSSIINEMLGFINFQNKNYEIAETYYRRALMIKETSSGWFNLGIIYDRMNKKNEMEQCMRKAIELDRKNHLALNYLGYSFLLEDKNIDEAFNLIQQAVNLDPENGAYLDSLGWAYYKKGNYKMAEKYLVMAEEKEKDPEIYEHLGYLYYKLNDPVKAIYWWARSLEIAPKDEVEKMIETAKNQILIRKK
jgi:tetratricopeptide (TPR) repeat protein